MLADSGKPGEHRITQCCALISAAAGVHHARFPHQQAMTRHMPVTFAPQPALDRAMNTPTRAGRKAPIR